MKHGTRLWGIFATVVLAGGLIGCSSSSANDEGGQSYRWQFVSGFPAAASGAHAKLAESFFIPELERRVAEETSHTLTISPQFGTVVGGGEEVGAFESGLAQIGFIHYASESSTLPGHQFALNVPFQSAEVGLTLEAFQAVRDEVPELDEELSEHNLKALTTFGTPSYGLLTDFTWNSLDELDGHKIGGAGANLGWLDGTGTVGVQANAPDWYTGLQTGVYDGVISWPQNILDNRLYETAAQYTDTAFGAAVQVQLSIGLDVWEGLPSEIQEIIAEVSDEFAEKLAAEDDGNIAAIERFEDEGLVVVDLDEELRAEWAVGLPDIPQSWVDSAETAGVPGARESMAAYLSAQETLGYEFPRQWLED